MFDYRKLRGKIRERYGTERDFAKALGVSPATLSAKLNNKLYFTQKDMRTICNMLDLSISDIPAYFFAPLV